MILNFEIRRRNWLSFRPNEFDLFLRCWHGHLVSSFHCFCFWCDTLQGLIWLVDCTAGVHGLSLKASRVYVVSLLFFLLHLFSYVFRPRLYGDKNQWHWHILLRIYVQVGIRFSMGSLPHDGVIWHDWFGMMLATKQYFE